MLRKPFQLSSFGETSQFYETGHLITGGSLIFRSILQKYPDFVNSRSLLEHLMTLLVHATTTIMKNGHHCAEQKDMQFFKKCLKGLFVVHVLLKIAGKLDAWLEEALGAV